MKETLWNLFVATGDTGYFRLYKKLDDDESQNKSVDAKSRRLQGK